MIFFSDRELGKKTPSVENIEITIWNGIVAIFESFISNNAFSKNFPLQCEDGRGIYGCNNILLNDKIKALISNIDIPITRKNEIDRIIVDFGQVNEEINSINTFAVLDFIEFCFQNISDVKKTDYHEYWGHYHLTFIDTNEFKRKFTEEINTLFERNGIAYKLNNDGKIVRILNLDLANIVSTRFKTSDIKLNELLEEATKFIILPKMQDRHRAIEKLWDAFERLKTYCDVDKRISITKLIGIISNGNGLLESYLDIETKQLTEIGNKFQIRHFESGKQPITDSLHLDYLFQRLLLLINLIITKLP